MKSDESLSYFVTLEELISQVGVTEQKVFEDCMFNELGVYSYINPGYFQFNPSDVVPNYKDILERGIVIEGGSEFTIDDYGNTVHRETGKVIPSLSRGYYRIQPEDLLHIFQDGEGYVNLVEFKYGSFVIEVDEFKHKVPHSYTVPLEKPVLVHKSWVRFDRSDVEDYKEIVDNLRNDILLSACSPRLKKRITL